MRHVNTFLLLDRGATIFIYPVLQYVILMFVFTQVRSVLEQKTINWDKKLNLNPSSILCLIILQAFWGRVYTPPKI